MIISALQPLTLIDFPGKTSCTIFTLGCNFRCHYCYNSEFVLPEKIIKLKDSLIPKEVLWNFLEKRKGLLEGVCITGGEPTIHPDLPEFIEAIKSRGFQVKLDTNGSNPKMLKKLLKRKLVDYVAMDIKAAPKDYEKIVGVPGYSEKVAQSKKILEKAHVPFEFRTVFIPRFHTEERKKDLSEFIGKKHFHRALEFTAKNGCLNPEWEKYETP